MADGRVLGGGVRISDPRVLRALAHPARIEIVEYLNNTGAVVTATECAGLVGLSPSAVSYHLRELAKYGLVEQAPSRGDGRERVWRSTGTGLMIDADPTEPGAVAASQALVELYLSRDVERVREWLTRSHQEPKAWQDASSVLIQRLLLTAEELTEVNRQVQALLEPYRMRLRQGDAPTGARAVRANYMSFPEATEAEE
ncbi:MAG: winged helix-turn-helix domain-containing protein [Actinoplanes sp.]